MNQKELARGQTANDIWTIHDLELFAAQCDSWAANLRTASSSMQRVGINAIRPENFKSGELGRKNVERFVAKIGESVFKPNLQ